VILEYHRPATVQQAVGLKRRLGGTAVYLAGGTYVNNREFPRQPGHLISLEALKLGAVTRARGGGWALGAGCTLQQLIEDRRVPEPLKAALSQILTRNVRNIATLGGHVAGRMPHSDVLPMLLALDARVARAGRAAPVPLAEFLAAREEGLITAIVLPPAPRGRVAACRNLRASANSRSILSAAVSLVPGRKGIESPIVALSGAARHAARLAPVERALDGRPLPERDELEAVVRRSVRPVSDLLGSAEFKAYQAGVLVARLLGEAWARKGGRA